MTTLYLPRHFEENDRKRIIPLIREYPFATLICVSEGAPVINHLPIILDDENATSLKLLGHLSRRNPLSTLLRDCSSVIVVFQGPHTYITPRWYAQNDVPTWNYAVAHLTGKLRWVTGFTPLVDLLRKMTQVFETGPDSWRFFLPDDLQEEQDLTSAIIGFEIEVQELSAKFKLSQNRSLQDQEGVIQGLGTRSDEMSRKTQEWMKSIPRPD